jgi:[acyl-carrier-protein] S-malonyltransferase
LMEEAGRDKETGMSSILGLDAETVERVCREASAAGVCVPANFNGPGQIAISGEKPALAKAAELAKAAGAKRVLPLNVSGAFHSPVMETARKGLEAALAEVILRAPSARFVNNADAKELRTPDEIRASLVRQVVSPVRWEPSCRLIVGGGEKIFYEVGPGRTLQGLMKRIAPEATVIPVGSMKDIEAIGAPGS